MVQISKVWLLFPTNSFWKIYGLHISTLDRPMPVGEGNANVQKLPGKFFILLYFSIFWCIYILEKHAKCSISFRKYEKSQLFFSTFFALCIMYSLYQSIKVRFSFLTYQSIKFIFSFSFFWRLLCIPFCWLL